MTQLNPNAQWHPVGSTDELSEDAPICARIGTLEVAVFYVDEEMYAIEDRCPHMDLPISDGLVDIGDKEITCLHHGARFCLKSGEVRAAPAFEGLVTYPVKIEDGQVFIQV